MLAYIPYMDPMGNDMAKPTSLSKQACSDRSGEPFEPLQDSKNQPLSAA